MENKTKSFPRGQLNPTILHTLLERDKYGYEIIEEIKEKTGIEVKQPSLYSSLRRMESQKYISSYWQDSDIGGKRHYYCLTAVGKEFLEKNPMDSSLFIDAEAEKVEEYREKEDSKFEEDSLNVEKNITIKEPELTTSDAENIKEVEFEKELRKTVQDIEKQVENLLESESNKDVFVQQDNIFNAIAEKTEIKVEKETQSDHQETPSEIDGQYALFEDKINDTQIDKIKRLHKKSSNNPYQLKHLSEEDLKQEYEKIRNQKYGIIAENNIKDAPNIWLDRNAYIASQKKIDTSKESKIDSVSEDTTNNFSTFSMKENISNIDKVFIAKSDNLDNNHNASSFNFANKEKANSPASLNIESNNYASFLNQQSTEDKTSSKTIYKYDYDKAMEKLENKFKEYAQSKEQNYGNETIVNKDYETKFDKNNDNSYERVQNLTPAFNSYKNLQVYLNSRGVGVSIYNKKDKNSTIVDSSLVRFVRGIIFSFISIILSFAFYFGIKNNSVGQISYVIIPILSLILPIAYGFKYYKKSKIVLNTEKNNISPVILPMVSICVALIILGINLALGFKSGKTLQYFPILIYPICLAAFIAFINPLNKLIKHSILFFRKNYKAKR